MNKINWKQKLSSRKFWIAVVGVIVGVAAAFGIKNNDYAQIAGLITTIISSISYIVGETVVDKSRLESNKGDITAPEPSETENSNEE